MNREIEELFKILKHAFGLPREMKLVLREEDPVYMGLVDGDKIYVYANSVEDAKNVLVHECIDILISALISYAMRTGDAEEIYRVKEAVVGVLERVVDENKLLRYGTTNFLASVLKRMGRSDLVEE